MDPLSISMACITLGELMFKASRAAASFVCDIRSAQADIDAMNSEFNSIKDMIDLFTEEFLKRTPGQLQTKITAVVANCIKITGEIHQVLSQYQNPLGRRDLRWAFSGKKELEKLRAILNAHRKALDIALDTIKLVAICDIKDDTVEIRSMLASLAYLLVLANIVQEIKQIKQHIFNDDSNCNFMLRRWLDDMSCYAGSIITSSGPNTAELRRFYGIKPEPPCRIQICDDETFVTGHAFKSVAPLRPNIDKPIVRSLEITTDSSKVRAELPIGALSHIFGNPSASINTTKQVDESLSSPPASSYVSPSTSYVSLQKQRRRVLPRIFWSKHILMSEIIERGIGFIG
ncbi:hypothetical protein M434DRAFT_15199 [Hypoxylon sp. CO27-5]|nr:hypothetical protein M434DRAFT_15199 [Hypoxylon sp. CO27-5]